MASLISARLKIRVLLSTFFFTTVFVGCLTALSSANGETIKVSKISEDTFFNGMNDVAAFHAVATQGL